LKTVPFHRREEVAGAAAAVVATVASGGVILLPTETFYGLGADADSQVGVDKIYRMKGRPAGMPLPVLCADWSQIEGLAVVPEAYRVRLSRTWPGPLTVIFPCRRPLAAAPGGSVAVRVPGQPFLRALLYAAGPLTGTSANRHGSPSASTLAEALAGLAEPPDLALDGGATPGGAATTLVDLSGRVPLLLRPGPAPWSGG